MQTKLLLAALAANSVNATKASDGQRDRAVEEKLLDIYGRCKLHIEGTNFEVKRAEGGLFKGRVTFGLADAEDCPALKLTVKTYVEKQDGSSRTETSSRPFTDDEIKLLIAGQTADMELFSDTAYPAYVVEIRATPKDLDCGLPFDLVFDRVPNQVKCEPVFSNLRGTVHCVGDCNLTSELNHTYDYDIDPATWNKWACEDVVSTFTATDSYDRTDLGTDNQPNAVVKTFLIPGVSLPTVTRGTLEPVHWKIEFFDKGEQIGHLETDFDSPHEPCKVTATGAGSSIPTNSGFQLSLQVDPKFSYTCGELERRNEFSDCKVLLAVDDCKNSICQETVSHSLLFKELPQPFCGTARWIDHKHNRQAGEFIPEPWSGNNKCDFQITDVAITATREANFTQTVHVSGNVNWSISCPEFNETLDYYVNNEVVHTETTERITSGPFVSSFNLPEFFGDLKVKSTVTPREGDVSSKFLNSNSLSISPEACVLTTRVVSEISFDSSSGEVTISTNDFATANDHWCLLPNISVCLTESFTDGGASNESDCFNSSDPRFEALLSPTGLIVHKVHRDEDFCYEHKINVSHDSAGHYPRQQPASADAELGQSDICNMSHCTLKGVRAELDELFTTKHEVLSPTYLVQGKYLAKMYIDSIETCPTLMASYEIFYAVDGLDFVEVKTVPIKEDQIKTSVANVDGLNLDFSDIEEKEGYYKVCVSLQKVEPSLYEQPEYDCSNVKYHKPACEYEITSLAHAKSQPDNGNTVYNHELTFEGFQNKWCKEMIASASVTDPWGGRYSLEQVTIANQANTFHVIQDDNFINGEDYVASVTWSELTPTQLNSDVEKIAFAIVDAGFWCQPSLAFNFTWAVDENSERWDFMEIKSHNYLVTYDVICESPVFTIAFDDNKPEFVLPQPQWPTNIYDQTFKIDTPSARQFNANLSITTHPLNGASKLVPTEPIIYVPLCYVSGVYWSNSGIKYGLHNEDPSVLSLHLEATVQGNCGDNVAYTLALDNQQFDMTKIGDEDLVHVTSSVNLGSNLPSIELPFDGALGHHININYEVNAVNAPRKDKGTTYDSFADHVTVSDHMRCVVKAEIEQVIFGENQGEKLEAQYDLKCKIEDCKYPKGDFTLFNEKAQTSSSYVRALREDELADCVRDYVRVTVVVENEPGCYGPTFHLMDKREPAESLASLNCVQYQPVCHTSIETLTKTGQRLNFDETIVSLDFHIQLESHQDRFCGFQMARLEFVDQNGQAALVHELDLTQIQKSKSQEGFTTTVELDNDVDTTYSVNLSYYDKSNTQNPAKSTLSNVYTYLPNTVCLMEIESFVLDSLTQEGANDSYTADFSIMAHVTDACRNDFEASINFIHNDEYLENYVLSDPAAIYRIRDDGTHEGIKLTIKNLTDLTGEFYGQIEMTAAGQYHIRDSASLATSW